ncbi:MAG TPA: VOC family protein [Solirubrobacterales bacterium]|nr:VOC family protein [Solirubrobacterales bacterium]
MSERSEYAPGEFRWVDLATTDVDGALDFYGELLGVEAEPAPGDPEETGGYGFLMKDGKMVAGYGPTQQEGQPPAWSSYISVENADETAEKVKEVGGQLHAGPFDLPNESGRMAVLQDSTGAFVCINEPQNHPGAQIVNEPGTWTWNNLLTRDLDAAKDFYGEVFGWRAIHNEEAPPGVHMWQMDGQRWPEGLAGLMQITDDMPAEMPPHWQVYFIVENADQAIEKAESTGAKLGFGPIDVPVGRLATLVDPQGAVVSIIESHYPEPR